MIDVASREHHQEEGALENISVQWDEATTGAEVEGTVQSCPSGSRSIRGYDLSPADSRHIS